MHCVLLSTFYNGIFLPGRVAQSVTCLATDACLTADPGVVSLIPAQSHTFVEIDHEIISTVSLLLTGDTDVMVLALYFNTDLKTNRLSELWMRAGVGDSTRYIPLHLIFERKPELCSVV